MSPRDGNLPAMASLRRDRHWRLSKVRALWALSQREMTSGAPAAGGSDGVDLVQLPGFGLRALELELARSRLGRVDPTLTPGEAK